MKKILISIITSTFMIGHAQVAIGKSTVANFNSVSLDFYDSSDNARGIILPWVSTVVSIPNSNYPAISNTVDGTLIMDLADYKIKYKRNNAWSDLTIKNKNEDIRVTDSNGNNILVTGSSSINSSLQENLPDLSQSRVTIGSAGNTDTTNGILVLSDTTKAMILPKVASPHLKIINPSVGTIAFDTVKKQLAVFNGTVWSFWKAN